MSKFLVQYSSKYLVVVKTVAENYISFEITLVLLPYSNNKGVYAYHNKYYSHKNDWAIPEKVRNPYVEEVGFSVQGGTPRKTWKIQGGQ